MEKLQEKLEHLHKWYDYVDAIPHTCPIINDIQNKLNTLQEESSIEEQYIFEEVNYELEELRDFNSELRDLAFEHYRCNNDILEIANSLIEQINDLRYPPGQLYLFKECPPKRATLT